MVITDFEPMTAWAAKIQNKYCLHVSHQASFTSFKTPRPWFWPIHISSEIFLNFFSISSTNLGIHFKPYDHHISSPILSETILQATPTNAGAIVVYLPAFSLTDQICFFEQFPFRTFKIFHAECKQTSTDKHLNIFPLTNTFKEHLIHASGYISSAGFQSSAEALYMKKPLLSIPIRRQYEQYCNAAALKQLGATVVTTLNYNKIYDWLKRLPSPTKIEGVHSRDFAKEICRYIYQTS